MKANDLTASEINGNKEKEILLIRQLFELDGYFADFFKNDKSRIETNIINDNPFLFETTAISAIEEVAEKCLAKYVSAEYTGLDAIPELWVLLREFGYKIAGLKKSGFISCSGHTEIHKFRGVQIMASRYDIELFAKGVINNFTKYAYFRGQSYDLIF